MINKNLFLFAKVLPKAENFQDAKVALLNIIEKTRKEEGCLQFHLHDDEQYLYLYEEWINENALMLHYEQTYTKDVFRKYESWLSKAVEVNKMYLSS